MAHSLQHKVTSEKLEKFADEVRKLSAKIFGADDEQDLLVETVIVDRTRYERLHYVPILYTEMNLSPRDHMDILGRDIMLNLSLAQTDAKRWWDLTELAMRREDGRNYQQWMRDYKRVPIKKIKDPFEREGFKLKYKVQYRLSDGSAVTPWEDSKGNHYEQIAFASPDHDHKKREEQWFQFVKLEEGELVCRACRRVYDLIPDMNTHGRCQDCFDKSRTPMYWSSDLSYG